jgi:hypothetical protein
VRMTGGWQHEEEEGKNKNQKWGPSFFYLFYDIRWFWHTRTERPTHFNCYLVTKKSNGGQCCNKQTASLVQPTQISKDNNNE